MVGKLNRLPVEAQRALRQFACMGNSAEFEMLRIVSAGIHRGSARPSLGSGAAGHNLSLGRFVPIPPRSRAGSGLFDDSAGTARRRRICDWDAPRRAHTWEKREEVVFEIVNQLNRGSHLISSIEERERVAGLNLIAGRRAKSSTAYASALKYLGAGNALLTEETWRVQLRARLRDRVRDR